MPLTIPKNKTLVLLLSHIEVEVLHRKLIGDVLTIHEEIILKDTLEDLEQFLNNPTNNEGEAQ
jgi:hypothetical protein